METVLKVNGIYKAYKQNQVLNSVSMTIQKGDIYGFVGKNGAGKSTAQKLICGLLLPASGESKLNGKPQKTERNVQKSAYSLKIRAIFRRGLLTITLFCKPIISG